MAAMFVNGLGRNEQSLLMTFHRCFLPSFGSFKWFQMRRFKCEKLTDDGRLVIANAETDWNKILFDRSNKTQYQIISQWIIKV
jgi:hypothetical protein